MFAGEIRITPQMLKLVAELDEFKGRWNAQANPSPRVLEAWKRTQMLETIASSARLHGSKLTDGETKEFLSGRYTTSFKSVDEEIVAGIFELMDFILERFHDLGLEEKTIKELHSELFQFASKESRNPDEEFTSFIRIKELMAAFSEDWEHSEWHLLILIPVFLGQFLAARVYPEGNQRLARGLMMLLLLKAGYKFIAYASLDRVLEWNKKLYLSALSKSERGGPTEWVLFFLECLVRQKNILAKKLEKERMIDSMPRQSSKIIQALKEHASLSIGELCGLLGDNRNTIKAHLYRLVEEQQIKNEGKGKGTRYLLA